MNKLQREKMLRAMDTIARALNDESVFMTWLTLGIADGDVEDGEELDEYYFSDEVFSDVMDTFALLMKQATKGDKLKGVFYVDGIVSRPSEE